MKLAGALARVHDLRHTYASILASEGLSLPIIDALLGHTHPQTTARYAHLFDDPLRAATEWVGALFKNGRSISPSATEGTLPLEAGCDRKVKLPPSADMSGG